MNMLHLARCCRFDLSRPVCTFAREITKWNRACDKRLHRLICHLKYTRARSLHGWIGDSTDKLPFMLFADASYADCVTTSKSATSAFAALVGPNAFFPLNSACKKQAVFSNSYTESEIVALDTALRIEGLPLLTCLGICGYYGQTLYGILLVALLGRPGCGHLPCACCRKEAATAAIPTIARYFQ